MKDEEAALLEKLLKDHKKKKEKKAADKPLTVGDLNKILQQQKGSLTCSNCGSKRELEDTFCPNCGSRVSSGNMIQIQAQPAKKGMSYEEKKQIAHGIWRDSRSCTIVCLIAMLAPLICALIGVIFAAAALLAALGALIYPTFIFVKQLGLQAQLHKKYGFKPILMFKPQQQMQQRPGSKNNNQEIF